MSSSSNMKLNPLAFMQKLSPAVFLYRPTNDLAASDSTFTHNKQNEKAPKLVLLLGWMDARDAHLARYVNEYRALYPQTTILLVKARLAGLTWSSVGAKDTKAAVAPMQADLIDGNSPASSGPQLLIHALSGGGSCSLYHLYNHFSQSSGDGGSGSNNRYIPLHTTIFDSTPGVGSYKFHKDVILASLKPGWQRLVALPVAHIVAATCWFLIQIMGVPDPQKTWSTSHNDKRINHEARRVYIYSEADHLCPASAVRSHAAEAEQQGFYVKLELFEGSGHISHMRADTERYWGIIEKTWGGVSQL